MRKVLSAIILCFTALLLSGCDHLSGYTITEQEVNQALAKRDNYQKDIGINGLATAHITLTGLQTSIGRQVAGKMTLSGNANLQLKSLFGQQNADVVLKMQAQPVFNPDQQAIYLQQLEITQSQVQPEKLQKVVTSLLPLLNQSLQQYFQTHPAYVLSSDRSTGEALAKRFAKGLEVKPGALVVTLTR